MQGRGSLESISTSKDLVPSGRGTIAQCSCHLPVVDPMIRSSPATIFQFVRLSEIQGASAWRPKSSLSVTPGSVRGGALIGGSGGAATASGARGGLGEVWEAAG